MVLVLVEGIALATAGVGVFVGRAWLTGVGLIAAGAAVLLPLVGVS